MKKRFTILTAVFALLAILAIPMGIKGQTKTEVVVYTLDGTITGGSNGYATESDITQSDITWMVTGNTTTSPWRIGGKNLTGVDRPLYSKSSFADNITKVIITNGTANLTVNSMTLIVSANADFSNPTSTVSGSWAASGTTTFERPAGADWTNMYFKLVYNVTAGSNNQYAQFVKAELYKEDASAVATPTFSPAEGTYLEAKNVTISTTTEGAAIYYTINGDDPTTNSSVYSSAITVSATTTIKAMAVKEGCNNSAVASATYTISSLEHAGTAADPYTVADAHTAIDANVGVSEVFATGIVSQIVTAYNSQYSNITFDLVDEEGSSVTLRAYRCEGDEAEDVAVGDIAVVSGNLTLYNGIYEFTQGCTLVSLTHPQAATIILNSTSIDLGNSNETGEQITRTFTVSQLNLTAGITLNLEGNGDIDITSIAMGAEPTTVTWTYTPIEAGNINATITATSAGAEPQTLTISGAAVAPVTGDRYEKVTVAPQDWSGCYIITGTNSGNYYALTGVDSNLGTTAAVNVVGNSIESNSTTDGYQVIVAQTTNGYSLYMDGVGYLGYNSDATSSNNYLHALESFVANTCEWTITMTDGLATITNVRNNGRTLQFNYNNGNSRFACYTSNQVKPTLFKYTGTVVVPPVINVTNNTISLEYDETEGSIAYTINNPVEGTNLTANSEAEWINNITVADDKVNFTTTVNEGNSDRTATITLSYTGATDKDVTVTQGHYVAPFEPATYTLATSIESGKTYIITDGIDRAMGVQNGTVRSAADVTIDESTATVNTADVYEFVISGNETDGYTIFDSKASGYLYASSSSSNNIGTRTENSDANSMWAIESGDENGVTITAKGENTRNSLRYNYNQGNDRFSCYGSNSSLNATLYLYVKEEETPEPETYELTINGYTDAESKAGYYLIASPVTVNIADVAGLTEGDFDLYSYDESQELEWINYKQEDGSHPFTTLEPGKGYLYAKKATAETPTYTFTLTGTPYNGTPIVLSKQSTGTLAGWNLIGNPLATSNIAPGRAFYIMNSTIGELIASESNTVEPMQGFFVIADEDGEEFELTVPLGGDGNLDKLVMNLSQNRGTVIDRAIVRFGEGRQLPKFQLNPNNTKIYFAQADNDYAVVCSASEGEMPVSFRASENGTYTLSFSAENTEMRYMHLIDNMTGNDIDLLQTPSYSFEAKTTDYANRFRLVFNANNGVEEMDEDQFAFFNGSEWVINNEGEATLQVIDMMGRVVSSQTVNGNANVNINEAKGVYVIRLIQNDLVKTQKIVKE